jgi:hypothetical protein
VVIGWRLGNETIERSANPCSVVTVGVMRMRVAMFVVGLALGVVGIAMAAGASVPPDSVLTHEAPAGSNPITRSEPQASGVTGIHGGSIARMHDATVCTLTDTASLPENWTHGDYVSAVAAGGSPSDVQAAATSECGMPTVAVQPPTADGASHAPDVPGPGTGQPASDHLPAQVPAVATDHASGAHS